MTYKAHIKNGVAVLDDGVKLPEGTEVRLEPVTVSSAVPADAQPVTLHERFADLIDSRSDLPADAARNKRHYLYGHQKS